MKTILLKEQISENIVTRESLKKLLLTVKEDTIFDFKEVEFMSRSCCDEYIKFKENTSFKIIEKNVNKDIRIILNAVSKTRNNPQTKEFTFTPLKAISTL